MSADWEAGFEEAVLDYFDQIGWVTDHGPTIGLKGTRPERASYGEVLLLGRLRAAIERLNPWLDAEGVDKVLAAVRRTEEPSLIRQNFRWHLMLRDGVPVEVKTGEGEVRHRNARLVDLRDPSANDYLAVNQYRVTEPTGSRRADVVAFINGIPVAVFELKRPGDEDATIEGAWNQLETYKREIPSLMAPTAFSVIADGASARIGALDADFARFSRWRTTDTADRLPDEAGPQIKILVDGVFEKSRVLELIEFFVDFGETRGTLSKRFVQFQQYWGVKAAVAHVLRASAPDGDRKAGIVFHGQGAGKSMEVLLIANRLMRMPEMANPTIVVLTDRNDLDDQLVQKEFAPSKILPETPVQADTRADLRKLLARASGGIILTTIQKFALDNIDVEPLLTERSNVVVMADEAHRTQYGMQTGYAGDLRQALPTATFLGFTGTPIEETHRSTVLVFGDYISQYTPDEAVEDGATVPIYYESRVAKIHLTDDAETTLAAGMAEITEGVSEEDQARTVKDWGRIEAILNADPVVDRIVADVLEHWDARRAEVKGKAMLVANSRQMAARFHELIAAARPDWVTDDDATGKVKVVYTGGPSDPEAIKKHVRSPDALAKVKLRAQDPDDELELAIVCDLWLTGFDSPSLHTMYLAKLMKGQGLFQAVTRPNRRWKDKPAGLVVSYVPVSDALREAVALFGSGKAKHVGAPVEQAAKALLAEHDSIKGILAGHTWDSSPAKASVRYERHQATAVWLSKDPDKAKRFMDRTLRLSYLFAIAGQTPEALSIRADADYFAGTRGILAKLIGQDTPMGQKRRELESAISSLVNGALEAEEVVDIYAAAGAERPQISLLSQETISKIAKRPHPALQVQILKKILNDEIRSIARQNKVRGEQLAELLNAAVLKYQNRALTDAEIIAELVAVAKEVRAEAERPAALGLSPAEAAFYDAVVQNESAVLELGDETLKEIARELVTAIRQSATLDWRDREAVRAELRVRVKAILKRRKYPPDKQESATELVLDQAKLFTEEMLAG